MKTILYLHAGAEMYGADKILLELVTGIDKSQFRPIVILPNDGILRRKLESNHIETYIIPYPILRRKYFNFKGIISYLVNYRKKSKDIISLLYRKNIHVDIIHINTMAVLEGIYLKKKLNVELIWHIHEILLSPKIVVSFLNYCVGKYSDEIVAVSNAVKKNLVASKKVPASKVHIIYNGIDSKRFSPQTDYDYLFKEWNIPRNSVRVGMIGRINSWKGQNDFLIAATPLLNKYSNLYLFIIGSAFKGQEWRVSQLKEKISRERNSNRIIYSPYRKDNNAVENFFDILVLPSTNPDPLPTVVLEAMGSGKAIVGYGHGGVTEMVENGVNGLLATPRATNDLRSKLNQCIENNTYKVMGKLSYKRQREVFSLDTFIRNFEDLYKNSNY